MKKKTVWISVCVVLLLALGLGAWGIAKHTESTAIAATVNGEAISRAEMENYRNNAQLSLQNGREQLNAMQGLTDEQKASMQAELEAAANKTDEEILNDLIRQKVILQEARRQGLEVSADAAYEAGKSAYATIKELAASPDAPEDAVHNYQVITDYMRARNLSEDAYLQQVGDVYQARMTRAALYTSWAATAADSGTDAFDAYVDTLVANADIENR